MSDAGDAIVVYVPAADMPAWRRTLDALNAKAARFGLSPIEVLSQVPARFARVPVYHERSGDLVGVQLERVADAAWAPPQNLGIVKALRITLQGPRIQLGHWQVVGLLEAAAGGGLVFMTSQDPADRAAAAARRECPAVCEHCGLSRNRNASFLLRDTEGGGYKQVGSTCLQDFAGIDPAAALWLLEMYHACGERETLSAQSSEHIAVYDVRDLLRRVAFLVAEQGFVSQGKARDTGDRPTWDLAVELPRTLHHKPIEAARYAAAEERDVATVQATLDWARTMKPATDFEINLQALLAGEVVRPESRLLATVAAAVPAYQRAARPVKDTAGHVSEPVGTCGDAWQGRLRLERLVPFETGFGIGFRINFTDEVGNRLSWKTSRCPAELNTKAYGRVFEGACKIKAHGEFKGVRTTEITHLKFMGWADALEQVPEAAAEAGPGEGLRVDAGVTR